jgi:hypothetical protein
METRRSPYFLSEEKSRDVIQKGHGLIENLIVSALENGSICPGFGIDVTPDFQITRRIIPPCD